MANWYSVSLSNQGSGTEYILPAGCCFPFKYSGVEYDNNNYVYRGYVMSEYGPTRYRIIPYSGAPSTWIKASRTTGSGNPSRRYLTGYPGLYITDGVIPSALKEGASGYTKLETTTISGQFRFGEFVSATYNSLLTLGTIPVNVAVNGVPYRAICLVYGKSEWDSTNSVANKFAGSSIAVYNEYTDPYTQPPDFTLLTTDYNTNELKSIYKNMVWDFGSLPQEVPLYFANFINTAATPIYPHTFTVKSQDGANVLGSLTEVPAMVDASVNVIGKVKTLTMTGTNGQSYNISWESNPPAAEKQFLGLAYEANEKRASIPIGITIPVTWDSSLNLYEVYGTYRPPVTTFDINLYQSSAEVNRVDKTDYLTGVGTLSGVLREECSINAPSITFKQTTVPAFNYVYIAAFARYYYVTDIISISKDIWRMSLTCDVLMSWKDDIRALTAIIARQENSFNPLLLDSELPAQANQNITVAEFPEGGFTTGTIERPFLLTVVGA